MPFLAPRLFGIVLAASTVVALGLFATAHWLFDYALTDADPIGAPIFILLLSYWIHLVLSVRDRL